MLSKSNEMVSREFPRRKISPYLALQVANGRKTTIHITKPGMFSNVQRGFGKDTFTDTYSMRIRK